jgi:hypothetical protein
MITFLNNEHARLYIHILEKYAHVVNRMDSIDREALIRRLFIMSKQILSEQSCNSLFIQIPVYSREE